MNDSYSQDSPDFERIHTRKSLDEYCAHLANQELIAFDTEFVSEDRYRPDLCLIQVATPSGCAIIDPMVVGDTTPFWEFLAQTSKTVVAHAAREEIRFCFRYTGRPIANLFDVQLAAGFLGLEYPASLSTLLQKLLGVSVSKGETRTDWRRRPLTSHQLDYAVQDVAYLPKMFELLKQSIADLHRTEWLKEETDQLQADIAAAETNESWRRVAGATNLPPRQMAIVRAIWRWREDIARQINQPPRRVLRDDLIIELARRGTSDERRIRSIRGMERRNLTPQITILCNVIEEANRLADHELPRRVYGGRKFQSAVLTQFLSTAIGSVCRQHQVAPAIVGNSDDFRDLLAYEVEGPAGELPALLRGWRAEVVGRSFHDLLNGKLAIRVANVRADQPLEFIRIE